MGKPTCSDCFYWHECPRCAEAGWCKKHTAFTDAMAVCEWGIDRETKHMFPYDTGYSYGR